MLLKIIHEQKFYVKEILEPTESISGTMETETVFLQEGQTPAARETEPAEEGLPIPIFPTVSPIMEFNDEDIQLRDKNCREVIRRLLGAFKNGGKRR